MTTVGTYPKQEDEASGTCPRGQRHSHCAETQGQSHRPQPARDHPTQLDEHKPRRVTLYLQNCTS